MELVHNLSSSDLRLDDNCTVAVILTEVRGVSRSVHHHCVRFRIVSNLLVYRPNECLALTLTWLLVLRAQEQLNFSTLLVQAHCEWRLLALDWDLVDQYIISHNVLISEPLSMKSL